MKMNFKDDMKADDERAKYKVYCKCGHSVIFTQSSKNNKIICDYCGYYIYRNEKEKFKELMKRRIKI